jgi:hypothetical protein
MVVMTADPLDSQVSLSARDLALLTYAAHLALKGTGIGDEYQRPMAAVIDRAYRALGRAGAPTPPGLA